MQLTGKHFAAAAVVAAVGLLGATLGYVEMRRASDPFAQCRGSAIASAGEIGGPFTLVDQDGKQVTDAQVLAKPALVYFGYTFCPDVCPLDTARNAEAVDILASKGFEVTPVFITIDPARDTPEVLKEFASMIHPKMLGLSGTEEQIKAAAQTYQVFYRKQPGENEYYMMDHTTFTYLMLPGIGFADFFNRDDTAQQIADRTACFLQAS